MLRSRRPLVLFVSTLLVGLPACDRVKSLVSGGGSEAESAEGEAKAPAAAAAADAVAPAAAAAPAADVAGAAAPAADVAPAADAAAADAAVPPPPCIVGRWHAIEYTEAVRRAIAKDPQLRSMKKTSSGGHITYVIDPPTQGAGAIRATADRLRYGFAGKVQGLGVVLDVDIDGDTEATYRLVGDEAIVVAKPTRNTMKVKASLKVKGLGSTRRRDRIDLDFDGSFVYACTADRLEVWRDGRSGRSMEFERAAPS